MGILTMEKWKAIPGQWGWQVSSEGRVKRNGRTVSAPEGSIKLGSESVLVADLVRQLFVTTGNNTGGFRRMLMLKKPSAAFINLGGGVRALANRRTAIPLKPPPGP